MDLSGLYTISGAARRCRNRAGGGMRHGGSGPPARHRGRQTMRGGQVRGSAWHVIQRTRRRPVRPAQGTLSPRQGGGVGTGPAAASGAGGGYRRCMEGPGGPVTSAWRVIRATARARVQDSGCLIGRCARRRGRRRGAAGHQLPVIGPVYGHGVRLGGVWIRGWRSPRWMACVSVPILFPNMASGTATERHRLCTSSLVYSQALLCS